MGPQQKGQGQRHLHKGAGRKPRKAGANAGAGIASSTPKPARSPASKVAKKLSAERGMAVSCWVLGSKRGSSRSGGGRRPRQIDNVEQQGRVL